MKIFFLSLICLNLAPLALGQGAKAKTPEASPQRENSVLFHAGESLHKGTLSETKSNFTLGISTLSHVPETDVFQFWNSGPVKILTTFGISGSLVKVSDQSPFPFRDEQGKGQKIGLGNFSYGKLICFRTSEFLQLCPGLEIAYLNLFTDDESSSKKNSQDYGAIVFDLRFGHYIGKKLKGGLEIQSFYVNQTILGQESSFGMTTYRLSLGFTLDD